MKEVNLEEILNEMSIKAGYSNFVHCFAEQEYTEEVVKQSIREACRQVLELGAKNARVKYYYTGDGNEVDYAEVKSDSITNTINQVK
jgi:hypothetical protein